MAKKNKLAKIKNLECLNCGYPFFGNEVYCPECGQKNQNDALSFKNFMNEVFQGFTSWDAKFWKTIIPLLTKPGKVSKDYVEGKRAKYTNPFRFYIITSILFFLLIGLIEGIKKYQDFSNGKQKINVEFNSITEDIDKGISDAKNENLNKKVTIRKAQIAGKDIMKFLNFQKKYPDLSINKALDSLSEPKTLFNKILYKKAKTIDGFTKKPKENVFKLLEIALSYLSTAIFILLPLFAFFLKLLYVRRKRNYIEHLIFVFHTQTVFFILLIILYPTNTLGLISNELMYNTAIVLFLVYFFIAMKVFYQQNYFKTSIKFLLTIATYSLMAIISSSVLATIAFILM